MKMTMNKRRSVIGPFEDDTQYLAWLVAHPKHFVLTSNKSLTPRHTVIHRTTCATISELKGNAAEGGFTRSYTKVGGASVAELRGWLFENRVDGAARECALCSRQQSA